MKIILDTNFLMIPTQFKVDIFSEIQRLVEGDYQLYIIGGTKRELEKLSKRKGKDASSAKFALETIERNNINVLKSEKSHVDDAIVEMSDKDTIVATSDRKLIKRLKHKSIKVLYLRSKNRLEMG